MAERIFSLPTHTIAQAKNPAITPKTRRTIDFLLSTRAARRTRTTSRCHMASATPRIDHSKLHRNLDLASLRPVLEGVNRDTEAPEPPGARGFDPSRFRDGFRPDPRRRPAPGTGS